VGLASQGTLQFRQLGRCRGGLRQIAGLAARNDGLALQQQTVDPHTDRVGNASNDGRTLLRLFRGIVPQDVLGHLQMFGQHLRFPTEVGEGLTGGYAQMLATAGLIQFGSRDATTQSRGVVALPQQAATAGLRHDGPHRFAEQKSVVDRLQFLAVLELLRPLVAGGDAEANFSCKGVGLPGVNAFMGVQPPGWKWGERWEVSGLAGTNLPS
jgi:hypothetical protein